MLHGRIARTLSEKPIEVVIALLLIGIGIALSLVGTTATITALGNVTSTVGGILFSWAAATIGTVEQAAEILRPQLETAGRHLATVTGQIKHTIENVRAGGYDEKTGFALVYQTTTNLHALVSEIQLLTKTPLDSQPILVTMETIEGLAGRLSNYQASLPEADDDDDEEEASQKEEVSQKIIAEIANLRAQLNASVNTPRPTIKSGGKQERVTCPHCNTTFPWMLGIDTGSTAIPRCPTCSYSFNLHRRSDGVAFTRPRTRTEGWGMPPSFPHVTPPVDPVLRVLRDQQILVAPPIIRADILCAIVEAFEREPERRFPNFAALDDRLVNLLAELNLEGEVEEAKKVRRLAFKAHVFRYVPPQSFIMLEQGVTKETILDVIERNLVSRLVGVLGPQVDPAHVCDLFYGAERARLAAIAGLIASGQVLPASTDGPLPLSSPPAGAPVV
jgi:hypothetical protein